VKRITIIAALARNRAIGMRGRMPWHLPDELRHFKRVTMGRPVVMGRKTFDSIGMVLPGRQNVVVSRNSGLAIEGCEVAGSLEQAVEIASGDGVMVIGGGELYRQALPLASCMHLTVVDCAPEADTWFPEWDPAQWELISAVKHPADERHAYAFEIQEWRRR